MERTPGLPETVGAIQHITIYGGRVEQIISQQQNYYTVIDRPPDRNRAVMLQKVQHIWVDGMLSGTLANDSRIVLDLADRPEAIALPMAAQYQEIAHRGQLISSSASIFNVFAAADGALLIIGGPGSGKTTLLLDLCSALLKIARRDVTHPIPVVFNLSSWANNRKPIDRWLVEELSLRYDVPRRIGEEWIRNGALLPLLDGLDEVIEIHRETCVAAINTFRAAHIVPLAVCAREADYAVLTMQLRMGGAIAIRPLERHQVMGFLSAHPDRLAGLHTVVEETPTLLELAKTPLMLRILSVAYAGWEADAIRQDQGVHTLWDRYIEAVFKRRSVILHYSREQSIAWLRRIARMLQMRGESILQIDMLQPDVLPQGAIRWYQLIVAILLGLTVGGLLLYFGNNNQLGWLWGVGTSLGMILGISSQEAPIKWRGYYHSIAIGIAVGLYYGAVKGTIGPGIITGLCAWAVYPLARRVAIAITTATKRREWHLPDSASIGLCAGISAGLGGALPYTLIHGLYNTIDQGIAQGLGTAASVFVSQMTSSGGGMGLAVGLVAGHTQGIRMGERLYWSWRLAAVGGLCAGATFGLLTLFTTHDVIQAIYVGLRVLFGIGLIVGLFGQSDSVRLQSERGIWLAARNTFFGLASGVLVSVAMLVLGASELGITAGLIVGLMIALRSGLAALYQHFVLRIWLTTLRALPLNCDAWLTMCADRLLLRRLGWSYLFIHRLLQEYLAADPLAQDGSPDLTPSAYMDTPPVSPTTTL